MSIIAIMRLDVIGIAGGRYDQISYGNFMSRWWVSPCLYKIESHDTVTFFIIYTVYVKLNLTFLR